MIKWGAFINPILYKYALIYFVCKIQFEENSFHYFVSQFTSSSPSYNLHGLNSASVDIALVWRLDVGCWRLGWCCGEAELSPTAWPRTIQPRPSVGPCPRSSRCRAQPPPAARPPPAQCRAFIIFVFPSLVLLLYKNMSVCCIATYLAIKYCIYICIYCIIFLTLSPLSFPKNKLCLASRMKKHGLKWL